MVGSRQGVRNSFRQSNGHSDLLLQRYKIAAEGELYGFTCTNIYAFIGEFVGDAGTGVANTDNNGVAVEEAAKAFCIIENGRDEGVTDLHGQSNLSRFGGGGNRCRCSAYIIRFIYS